MIDATSFREARSWQMHTLRPSDGRRPTRNVAVFHGYGSLMHQLSDEWARTISWRKTSAS